MQQNKVTATKSTEDIKCKNNIKKAEKEERWNNEQVGQIIENKY